jgi:hypothetical protein
MSFFEVLERAPQRGAFLSGITNMRYRTGEAPGEAGMSMDQGFFLAIALLNLAIGIGFV